MNLFHPRTLSTDWEVMVIDKLERAVSNDKLMGFAGILKKEFDIPVNTDWNTLEFALGINRSFEQLWDRIQKVTDRAAQLVREFDLEMFPAAAHPAGGMWMYNASHIHVGTVHDEAQAIHLENQMVKYVPAFAALAANSPIAHGARSEHKSQRVRHLAWGCSVPNAFRDPHLAQVTWGSDAAPKVYGGPTMEVRITDCASSRRLLAEMAIFVAAYLHHRGTRIEEYRPTPGEYQNCMTNRWAAARHGMQATFLWDGLARPVADVLDEMLDECRDALEALGVRRSDLVVLNTMVQKRVCQADFLLELADRYPDPYCLASVYAKLIRRWEAFDEYVESARALEPAPIPDEDAILAEHLAHVGEGTHYYRSREAMWYPPPAADAIIEQMVERGLIRREVIEDRGIVLSRL